MLKPPLAVAWPLLVLLAVGDTQTRSAANPSALQAVDVIRNADSIQVEIRGRGPLAPKVMTLGSPPRVVVALPGTAMFTSYRRISVASGYVNAVRIGTDGRTPPTTTVVIDCLQTCGYELLPGSGDNVIVRLHAAGASSGTVGTRNEAPARGPASEKPPGTTIASLLSPPPAAAPGAAPLYAQKTAAAGLYNGPGGCAASSCHGSVQPKTTTRIFQNEYTIWIAQDKHAKAFSVLRNNVSERIGRILNIGSPAKSPKCLVCHALYVPPEQQAQTFELGDGVSCENCHGPASGWLGPHTTKNWPHEKSIQLGMYDTRNLERRSAKCLTCHLGTAEKFVDHEMIAAGHPDLTFELGLFSFVMPPHWKIPEQGNPWRQVQAWGVGQAVQLRESFNRLARRANGPIWPEYAELECFACHHSLTQPEDSWRQARGYAGRRPGNPPWNQSRVVVFRDLVGEISPNSAKQLDDEVSQLASLMNQLNSNREQIAASATRASALADQLVKQVDAQGYDSAVTLRLMRRVAADGTAISNEGERSAEQAAFTLDSLYRAYNQNEKPASATEVRAEIEGLFALLNDASGYSAPRFAAQMQRVSHVVGR
jgi:AMIN domain-containing protein/cytochrome c554/c'-like protein